MMAAYTDFVAQLPQDERARRIAIAQAGEGDTLLTGLVQRGREILARRLAEALQQRPGPPVDWETAVAWATFFANLDVAAAMISRPGWTFDDGHAAIERLAKIVAPQAFPRPKPPQKRRA